MTKKEAKNRSLKFLYKAGRKGMTEFQLARWFNGPSVTSDLLKVGTIKETSVFRRDGRDGKLKPVYRITEKGIKSYKKLDPFSLPGIG